MQGITEISEQVIPEQVLPEQVVPEQVVPEENIEVIEDIIDPEPFTIEDEDEINPEAEVYDNKVKGMSREKQKELAEKLIEGYKDDLDSMSDLIAMRKEWNKLFDLLHETKSTPWTNAANIKLPMITTACYNFQARAYGSLFSQQKIVNAYPIGKELSDVERASRVSNHMNWQLNYQMKEFFDGFDKSLTILPREGTSVRKTFYDSSKKRTVSTFVHPNEFVANYYTKNINDAFRLSHILYMNLDELQQKEEDDIFVNVDKLEYPDKLLDLNEAQEEKNKSNNLQQPTADELTPRTVIEMHVKLKLGKDKTAQPYIINIDLEDVELLRIEEAIDPNTNKPMSYFTLCQFLPNDSSIFGYGFGQLLMTLNLAINTAINQTLDAGHLANVKGGFITKQSGIKRGDLSFDIGEFKEIDLRVTDDIRKAIYPMNFDPPSSVLTSLINFLQGYAEKLTTVTDIFTGSQPKSDTTATAALQAVEQGSKMFTAIIQRVVRSFSRELEKIYTLNGIYLDEIEYFNINVNKDESLKQQFELKAIAKEDYLKPMDVIPTADPNINSQAERIGKSDIVQQTIAGNPLLANSPEAQIVGMTAKLKAVGVNETVITKLSDIIKLEFQKKLEAQINQAKQEGIQEGAQQAQQAQQAMKEQIKAASATGA